MSSYIILVPESKAVQYILDNNLVLSKLNQKLRCLEAIKNLIAVQDNLPGKIIWINNDKVFNMTFSTQHLYFYKNIEERFNDIEKLTGLVYRPDICNFVVPHNTKEEIAGAALVWFRLFFELLNTGDLRPGLKINTEGALSCPVDKPDLAVNLDKPVATHSNEPLDPIDMPD